MTTATQPPPSPFDWAAMEALTGCSRERYYAGLAEALLVAGARMAAGYMATAKKSRGARRLAYTLGVATPEPKLTRAEEIRRDAVAFDIAA